MLPDAAAPPLPSRLLSLASFNFPAASPRFKNTFFSFFSVFASSVGGFLKGGDVCFFPLVSIGVGVGVGGVAVLAVREGVVELLLLLVSVDACTLECTLVQSTFFGCKFTLFRFKKGLGVGAFG
jgi:hypothetical protein